MRFNNTLTRAMIAAASFFVLACQGLESPETQEHKIVASVGAYNTKANFHTTETLNVTCDWNGRETLRVYYKKSDGKYHSIFANSRIAKLEEGGKSADFTYSPEPEWGLDGKDQSYQVAVFTVNCAPTIDPADGSIYLDARLIRQPLKDFELPVYYVGEVVNGSVEATFSHYYAYEFLHVKNLSDKSIDFSLNGYETPWIWYKRLASVGLEDGVIYNKSWSGLTPAEVSYPVSIDPGSSDIIVSAYIPNDFIIKDAAIVATIDGNIVTSTNKKSSAAPLVPGRAYHMYATWDGNELKFDKANELPDELGIGFTHLDMQEDGAYGFTTGREGHLSFESTDPSVATAIETDDIGDLHVDIRSHTIGTAIITITDTDTGQKSQIEVVVRERTDFGATVRLGETESVKMKNADGHYEAYSDDDSIATCEVRGSIIYVTGRKTGETTIHVTEKNSGKQFNIYVLVYNDGTQDIVPEAVDLGLPSGLKWASFNLGASKPEGYGDYYAWGEIEPYYSNQDPLTWKEGKESGYSWESYKWCMGDKASLTNYCYDSSFGYNGFTDNKTVLDPEDDAAHVNLGGLWRMPTVEEWFELESNCTWTWTTQNGVKGRLVMGSNGNSIFLPAAGHRHWILLQDEGSEGFYWSSSLGTEDPCSAWYDVADPYRSFYAYYIAQHRCHGFSIRPVYDDSASPEIEVTPTDINFETVEYETTKTRPFTVKNTGNGILSFSISCVCHDNVFEVNDGGATYSLASGASQEFMVTAHGMKRNSKASCDIRVIPSFGDGTKTVNVKAEGWDNKPLTLETPAKTIRVGEEDRVNILFGSLDYGISNDNPTIVDAIISTQGIGGGGWYDSWQSTYKYVNLKALATGTATIKVTDKERGEEATIQVTVSGGIATPEAIDLGLPSGLKWASFNLGASKPEEYGDYYAWGETEPYYSSLDPLAWKPGKESGYTWSSYRWSVDGYSLYSLIKYCTNPDYNDEGFTDGKTVLEPDDDAAHVNLGGGWRMPTREEYDELIKECTWEKTTVDGISVRKITGPSGKYILLPVAGSWNGTGLGGLNSYGYYWSSSVDAQDPGNAYCICIMSNSVSESRNSRCGGFPVRPVCD